MAFLFSSRALRNGAPGLPHKRGVLACPPVSKLGGGRRGRPPSLPAGRDARPCRGNAVRNSRRPMVLVRSWVQPGVLAGLLACSLAGCVEPARRSEIAETIDNVS